MGGLGTSWRARWSPQQLVVACVAAAALVSALAGANIVLDELGDIRREFGDQSQVARDGAAARSLGFDPGAWRFLAREVRPVDRYAIFTEHPAPHEVRNYAAYWLLPAVRVLDARRADVVVYVDQRAPAGARCFVGAQRACVVRRRST